MNSKKKKLKAFKTKKMKPPKINHQAAGFLKTGTGSNAA